MLKLTVLEILDKKKQIFSSIFIFGKGCVFMEINFKSKSVNIVIIIVICFLFNGRNDVYANMIDEVAEIFQFQTETENEKVAYITFDDGLSIHTEELLDILKAHELPGIFFVLGAHFEAIPNTNEILNRIVTEGHHIALHTMTHDKCALYFSEKSPTTFTQEMLELKREVEKRTGHVTNLCRAPYGKKGNFKVAHFKSVAESGLYCVDWHIDSRDWEKKNARQIYNEVVYQLEQLEEIDEVLLLFHEFQRTVEAMPMVIEYLASAGYTFKPYVEGKVFKALN